MRIYETKVCAEVDEHPEHNWVEDLGDYHSKIWRCGLPIDEPVNSHQMASGWTPEISPKKIICEGDTHRFAVPVIVREGHTAEPTTCVCGTLRVTAGIKDGSIDIISQITSG